MKRLIVAGLMACLTGCTGRYAGVVEAGSGRVQTYYVAADEVDWNDTPERADKMMGWTS
ncbi:MAG TPA: hypothetical protein VMH81_18840 [Bryobacteraceae bacterium]|nr:hypothetical protein [Bryobacteraceae bacterium]